MLPKKQKFVIRLASSTNEGAILDFHKQNITEHLWPRTVENIREYIEDEMLFEVVDLKLDKIIGMCYIAEGNNRYEFGGVCLDPEYRGYGLATILGSTAIAQHYISLNGPIEELIAHVHEFNQDPLELLQKRLGFRHVGQEIPPDKDAPKSMKRNEKGQVVGLLFEFNKTQLDVFGDWFGQFDGNLNNKAHLQIEIASMTTQKIAKALKDIFKKYTL